MESAILDLREIWEFQDLRRQEYIQKYLKEFSGVDRYMKEIVEKAKNDGYVRTLFGRIRYIDELSSSNYNTRSFGQRAAMNTPIQGTARIS